MTEPNAGALVHRDRGVEVLEAHEYKILQACLAIVREGKPAGFNTIWQDVLESLIRSRDLVECADVPAQICGAIATHFQNHEEGDVLSFVFDGSNRLVVMKDNLRHTQLKAFLEATAEEGWFGEWVGMTLVRQVRRRMTPAEVMAYLIEDADNFEAQLNSAKILMEQFPDELLLNPKTENGGNHGAA